MKAFIVDRYGGPHAYVTRPRSPAAPRSGDEPLRAALRRSARLQLPSHLQTVEEFPSGETVLRKEKMTTAAISSRAKANSVHTVVTPSTQFGCGDRLTRFRPLTRTRIYS